LVHRDRSADFCLGKTSPTVTLIVFGFLNSPLGFLSCYRPPAQNQAS
jgi:hypothetical protein